jgi:hypothetical protein
VAKFLAANVPKDRKSVADKISEVTSADIEKSKAKFFDNTLF